MILSTILAVGAGVLITRIVFDTVEERFSNQLIEAGLLVKELFVQREEQMLESVRLIARSGGVSDAITAQDADTLRDLVYGIAVNNSEELVALLDPQGLTALMLIRPPEAPVENYAMSTGGAVFSTWDGVQRVLLREEDTAGDKFAGWEWYQGTTYFYISGPVYDQDGSFAGVIVIGNSLQELSQNLLEETRIHTTLYTLDGQQILTTLPYRENLPSEIANQVLNIQQEGSIRHTISRDNDTPSSRIEYEELLAPWEARDGMDLGILGAALPKSFLVHASTITRFQIFALTSIALILVIGSGLYIAQRITTPLRDLVDASSKVAEGRLEVSIDTHSNDELEVLTESFNIMVANLRRSKEDLIKAYDTALEGWAKALELRDEVTEGHTRRVVKWTLKLAAELGYSQEELENIRRGALLHDIGKMGIPDSILMKPGPLTDDEMAIMKTHPQIAYDLIKNVKFLKPCIDIPYYHHEKWDGSGYPNGLQGEAIPLAARIFSVVDVWDALSNDRPYRKAWPKEKVVGYLIARRGVDFDPHVVDTFIHLLTKEGIIESHLEDESS